MESVEAELRFGEMFRGSGNELMDDSVMKAVNSVKTLRALPPGHRRPVDISITFEIEQ